MAVTVSNLSSVQLSQIDNQDKFYFIDIDGISTNKSKAVKTETLNEYISEDIVIKNSLHDSLSGLNNDNNVTLNNIYISLKNIKHVVNTSLD